MRPSCPGTANDLPRAFDRSGLRTTNVEMLSNDRIDPLFYATIEATEGREVRALPHGRLRELLGLSEDRT